MKSKMKFIVFLFIFFFSNFIQISADQFKYLSDEIRILDNGNVIVGENNIEIEIGNNLHISAESFKYTKNIGELEITRNIKFEDKLNKIYATGSKIIYYENLGVIEINDNVKLIDKINKIEFTSSKVSYDTKLKLLEILNITNFIDDLNSLVGSSAKIFYSLKDKVLYSDSLSNILYSNEYNISLEDFNYDIVNKKINSKKLTRVKDNSKNYFEINGFILNPNLNKLLGQKAKLIDTEKNEYYLEDFMINTSNKNIFGRELNINFNKSIFNDNRNDPRIRAKSIKIKEKSSVLKKGVFTTCNKDHECPPWSLYAEEIEHDKEDQTIKYKNAWLKIYDKPTLYFPKFSHPDPTVKRKSGFLAPKFGNSKNLGTSINIPYYHVISDNKDFTFKPTLFFNDEIVLQNEFRQVNKSSEHIVDFSVNPSNYLSSNSSTKMHFFSNSKFFLNSNFFNYSNVDLNLQRVNNDEYLNEYKIENSKIIQDQDILHSYVNFEGDKDNIYFSSSLESFENLNKDKSSRYEFIYPKYRLEKKFDFDSGNTVHLKTYGSQRKYNTNVYEGIVINDLLYESISNYSKIGLVSNINSLVKNVNVDANNSQLHKNNFEQSLSTVFQYNLKYPMFKESSDYNNNLTPKLSLMFSPNKTKNISNTKKRIENKNIFSFNRIANDETVEGGASLTYGINYSKTNNKTKQDFLNFDISTLIRMNENLDLPKTSSLGQKSSDVFGNLQLFFNKNFDIKYNFALDNNLDKSNYDIISTTFSFNKLVTSFEYFDEKNNFDNESFTSNSTLLNINENNSINFNVRRNNELSATEYYNLIYNYKNDCLTASVKFKKEFYQDSDLKPEREIFFELSLLPFSN